MVLCLSSSAFSYLMHKVEMTLSALLLHHMCAGLTLPAVLVQRVPQSNAAAFL